MKINKLILTLGLIGSLGATNMFITDVFSSGKSYPAEKLPLNTPKLGDQFSWTVSSDKKGTVSNAKYELTGLKHHDASSNQDLWLSNKGLDDLKNIWEGNECKSIATGDQAQLEKTLMAAINNSDEGKNECSKKLNSKLSDGVKNNRWAWYYK